MGMSMVCRTSDLKLKKPNKTPMSHDYLLSVAFALNSDYFFIDKQLVKYRQHENNAVGIHTHNGKRLKKNKSIWQSNYERKVNLAYLLKHDALEYALRFNKAIDNEEIKIATKELEIVKLRIQRVTSFRALFCKSAKPFNLSRKGACRWFFKDLERLIKIKLHRLIAKYSLSFFTGLQS